MSLERERSRRVERAASSSRASAFYGPIIGRIIVTIWHTLSWLIAQAGARKHDVHAAMHAALQSDACFGHGFWHPWTGHWLHDTRFVLHVFAHAEAVEAHTTAHDGSGVTGATGVTGAASVWTAWAASPASAAASVDSTLRAPSSTMSSHPFDASIRTRAAHFFTMRNGPPTV